MCHSSIHAEIDAYNKLIRGKYANARKIKKEKIDLIVIRINKNGELKQSRPCKHCINKLINMANYKIGKVYYSDENGNIVSETLTDLINNSNYVTSGNKR